MKKGFMELAIVIINEFPGWTAVEVAQEALEHDSSLSDSKNPVQSLASTLNKQVQTKLEQRIWRKKLNDGLYHYYPISSLDFNSNEAITATFSLATQELTNIDNLVAVGKYKNRNEVIKWLIIEGIKANRAYLDKVADRKAQIERLKEDL